MDFISGDSSSWAVVCLSVAEFICPLRFGEHQSSWCGAVELGARMYHVTEILTTAEDLLGKKLQEAVQLVLQ